MLLLSADAVIDALSKLIPGEPTNYVPLPSDFGLGVAYNFVDFSRTKGFPAAEFGERERERERERDLPLGGTRKFSSLRRPA